VFDGSAGQHQWNSGGAQAKEITDFGADEMCAFLMTSMTLQRHAARPLRNAWCF